jgi:hypothetical protein
VSAISGASKMMPRKVIEEIGHLEIAYSTIKSCDYCKRDFVDGGYYNHYY